MTTGSGEGGTVSPLLLLMVQIMLDGVDGPRYNTRQVQLCRRMRSVESNMLNAAQMAISSKQCCHAEQKEEPDVGVLRIMSRRGDDRVAWDHEKVAVGDPEAVAAVREAERIFAQERARGATAFKVEPGQSPQRIEIFDPKAEQIVMIPRVVGG